MQHTWALSTAGSRDLGGSANLNLLVTDGASSYVARVYRRHVTPERLAGLQFVRRHLAANGVPYAEPIPTRSGESWASFGDGLVELEPFVDATGRMNTLVRVRAALPLLGRIHSLLRDLRLDRDAATPVFANHIGVDDLAVGRRAGRDPARDGEAAPLVDRGLGRAPG